MGQTMDTNYVFAGLVVKNRDHAAAWYERDFSAGRLRFFRTTLKPSDNLPVRLRSQVVELVGAGIVPRLS
jgi:hypothetical protein